jgi:zinc protease
MTKLYALLLCFISLSTFAITPLFWKTQQNIPVVFYQTQHTPAVTLHVAFRAGSAFDNQLLAKGSHRQDGLATLTADMMSQGNDGLSANQLANEIAASGAIFAAATNRDMADFSLTTLTDPQALKQATRQFNRILTRPEFPPVAFAQQKDKQNADILEEKESPEAIARDAFFSALYPNHPYGHSIDGTSETLKNIQRQDCIDFYHHFYVAENAVIVIVGALTQSQATDLSNHLLETLPHGTLALPIPLAHPPLKAQTITLPFSSSQTALYLGQLGITHHDPRYFPLIVGNYILGGSGLVSRLFDEIREKKGLTYGVYSDFMPMPGKGPFLITLSTEHQQTQTALQLTKTLLADYVNSGPTPNELETAKKYLIGSFPLSFSSNTEIANVLLRLVFYELPHDYLETYLPKVQAVTPQDVKTAFQAVIHPNTLLVVSVGPEK